VKVLSAKGARAEDTLCSSRGSDWVDTEGVSVAGGAEEGEE
jgi:hypothetical protein